MLIWLAVIVGVIGVVLAWRESVKDKKLDGEMDQIRREIADRDKQ
jgi:heme exporter protein D